MTDWPDTPPLPLPSPLPPFTVEDVVLLEQGSAPARIRCSRAFAALLCAAPSSGPAPPSFIDVRAPSEEISLTHPEFAMTPGEPLELGHCAGLSDTYWLARRVSSPRTSVEGLLRGRRHRASVDDILHSLFVDDGIETIDAGRKGGLASPPKAPASG